MERVPSRGEHVLRELREWLRTNAADPDVETFPDQAGTVTGQHVLAILGRRRTDLTDDDARVMRTVIDRIHAARRADLEPVGGQAAWRHRLMSLGHDPLKSPA